jgi:hypothetical protein
MSWVKRNLYFVIGTVVAVILLGLAGWYFYNKYALNNTSVTQLNQAYEELKTLNNQKPHPGSGSVDNIKNAKEQQQQLKAWIDTARKHFQPIPPIPDVPKLSDRDFSQALSGTLAQLRRDAVAASVSLPQDYFFSFQAQHNKVTFAPGTLGQLSTALGEVKAIAQVLFAAKVNSLDYLRRERTADDMAGNATDYLGDKSVTNELAVVTPYELSFRSFSPELAGVLSGFANSPDGLVVKTVNVEQVGANTTADASGNAIPGQAPVPPVPGIPGQPTVDRFGRPIPGAGTTPAAASATAGKGLPIVLDEKQLRITITLMVVKPAGPAARNNPATVAK